jgi:acyl-CoA reductase-like NAD-dependent aldehyde dehydrogenase
MSDPHKNGFEVLSPYDNSFIGSMPISTKAQAFSALEEAYKKYSERESWLIPATRISILRKFVEFVKDDLDSLAKQAAREGGKPLKDSIIEVQRGIEGVEVAIEEIGQLGGTEIPMRLTTASAQRFAHTFREPRGVVLAISAFNHPFNLIIHQVITAIAAGCPVLVKPASATPLSALSIVGLLAKAGLPDGWCQLLTCKKDVTEELVGDTRISFMTFIGSGKVGWYLRSKLAPGAACALEHGGAAPVIVDETADLSDSIPLLTRGGFYHAGQVCVSVQRLFVHHSILDDFVAEFVKSVSELKVGDPLDLSTDVGPLISEREVERVDEWVQAAVQAGAQVLCGGQKLSTTMYAPTVLLDPPDDALISTREIFGPVVAVYSYKDLDEAITRANGPDFFFQASIFTKNLDTALSASRRLHGTAVMVNDHSAFRVDWMPFGGHRQSGLGIGGIGHSIRDMTLERMVVFRSAAL